MKFFITIPNTPRQSVCNSMLPITHCLIGKRRDDFEKPSDDLLTKSNMIGCIPSERKLTGEEREEVAEYRRSKATGKYAFWGLTWVQSEEEGGQVKLLFKEPEWDQESLQLIPARRVQYER